MALPRKLSRGYTALSFYKLWATLLEWDGLPQVHREERDIYSNIRLLIEAARRLGSTACRIVASTRDNRGSPMLMSPYLNFKGDCEAAFTFYAQALRGQLGELHRYGGSPMAGDVSADWSDKVMHGSVTIGGQVLMGADIAKGYEAPKGFSLSLHLKDAAEAERMFAELAKGGAVIMPLEKTFWAERFGVVTDRFGIQWSINCGA